MGMFESFMNTFVGSPRVGILDPDNGDGKWHALGMVFVPKEGTDVPALEEIQLVVDKPHMLEKPWSHVIKDIFLQIYAMGRIPLSLIVDVPGEGQRTYFARDYAPDIAYMYSFHKRATDVQL